MQNTLYMPIDTLLVNPPSTSGRGTSALCAVFLHTKNAMNKCLTIAQPPNKLGAQVCTRYMQQSLVGLQRTTRSHSYSDRKVGKAKYAYTAMAADEISLNVCDWLCCVCL
jgi:hypothetical protein